MQFSINPKFVVDQVLEFWKKKKNYLLPKLFRSGKKPKKCKKKKASKVEKSEELR